MIPKIKVMHLVWSLSTGGVERVVLNIAKSFSHDPDIEVCVYSLTENRNMPFDQIVEKDCLRVVYVDKACHSERPWPMGKLAYGYHKKVYIPSWIRNQIIKYHPDAIHIHQTKVAALIYPIIKQLGLDIPVYCHIHSMPETFRTKYADIIKTAISDGTYTPICVTEMQAKSAAEHYKLNQLCRVIYPGIDIAQYKECHMTPKDRSRLRNQLGYTDDDFVIGSAARIVVVKNHEKLITALSEAVKIASTAKLLILGDGYPDMIVKFDALSRKFQVHDKVKIINSQQHIEQLYRIMDVFALASYHEACSLVSVEAQLSGIGCVLSDRIPTEVIISDGVVQLPPDAPDEKWASALCRQRNAHLNLRDYERFAIERSMSSLKSMYLRDINA